MRPLSIAALIVAFVLLLPVIVPLGLAMYCRDRLRLRSAARRFVCLDCGNRLGTAAIRRADVEWGRYVDDRHRRYPDVKFRLRRRLHAVCPACGRRYQYVEKARTFVRTGPCSSFNGKDSA